MPNTSSSSRLKLSLKTCYHVEVVVLDSHLIIALLCVFSEVLDNLNLLCDVYCGLQVIQTVNNIKCTYPAYISSLILWCSISQQKQVTTDDMIFKIQNALHNVCAHERK